MSKLYDKFRILKEKDPTTVYLFKSGIFYIALQEDAQLLAKELHFKLTPLNNTIVKCGFPSNSLEKYIFRLEQKHIPFEIIDSTYTNSITNYTDYLYNVQLQEIVQNILKIDFNYMTFKQSFDYLYAIQKTLQKIYDSSIKEEAAKERNL